MGEMLIITDRFFVRLMDNYSDVSGASFSPESRNFFIDWSSLLEYLLTKLASSLFTLVLEQGCQDISIFTKFLIDYHRGGL